MAADIFPTTKRTWIDLALDRGPRGRLDVNAHVMETYEWPLRVYYLGTNLRWLGEPEDVVGGFFADRLARADFLANWRTSGMRLRRWLMNGFSYYLLEVRRARRREAPAADVEEPATFSGDPSAAVDRAAVVAFVRQAMELTAQRCAAGGMEAHWRVFLRHHHDGIPFREIAPEFGVDLARAAVMARTAARKFQAALREVLGQDGVAADRIDEEIQSLLEASEA